MDKVNDSDDWVEVPQSSPVETAEDAPQEEEGAVDAGTKSFGWDPVGGLG